VTCIEASSPLEFPEGTNDDALTIFPFEISKDFDAVNSFQMTTPSERFSWLRKMSLKYVRPWDKNVPSTEKMTLLPQQKVFF